MTTIFKNRRAATFRAILASGLALQVIACSASAPSTSQRSAHDEAPSPAIHIGGNTAADIVEAENLLRGALKMYASPAAYDAAQKDEVLQAARGTLPQLQRLFTPSLAQKLDRAYKTEGGIDADPICMCQDDADLVVRSFQSVPQSGGRLQTNVSFSGGHKVSYQLERTPDGWRVGNVLTLLEGQKVSLLNQLDAR